MAVHKWSKTFAFSPVIVTIIIPVVYLTISIALLFIHETVPSAPSNPIPYSGVNTTEAWLDLARLTSGYHPYNSRKNDEVRNWLLLRIEEILKENEAQFQTITSANLVSMHSDKPYAPIETTIGNGSIENTRLLAPTSLPPVTVFNDMQSNLSFSALGSIGSDGQGRLPGLSVYFEGTNIMVYIRGTEDKEGEWWNSDHANTVKDHGRGGVLVNAHYDSVSTGFGATDDGMGVVTVLQLIRFFTTPGNQPKKGIVALLNNGEEDYLNGARAYTQHPISEFAYTFLNLEGAGAGGRATLFRSTDAEVTMAYATSPHPFGTVVAADGFKMGFIRSGTDYTVFQDTLGLRGLDLAFWYPRARYHTDHDDSRHTSLDSLWHMLSASVNTLKALTSDMSSTFDGPRSDGAKGKVRNGYATDGVWFDIFGKGLAVFGLRGLFAWSLALLIASPLILMLIVYLLVREGKFYFFTNKAALVDDEDEPISLHGWHGAFRFPVALIVASGITIGCTVFISRVNPLIIYSSHYAVWSMMLSLYFTVFWFIMKLANFMRPSALHRGYALLWMFIIGWATLVATTVFEDRFKIASGYLFVFFESGIFLAALIGLCELFALPSKADYAEFAKNEPEDQGRTNTLPDSDALAAPDTEGTGEDEATETTPLFGGSDRSGSHATTFAHYARRSLGGADGAHDSHKPFGSEQGWSGKLPTWTWLLQFLLVGPFIIVVIGQVALLVVEATSQTGSDGNSLLTPYKLMAFFSILLLLPISPFYHRISYHIPAFLFLVFVGTLLYSALAFPFSANNRYKAYFQQTVDLETGQNHVTLAGLEDFIRPIIASLPSAAGQTINCETRSLRNGLRFCSWSGLPPKVVDNYPDGAPPKVGYADWLEYNVTRIEGSNAARFVLSGQDTRACVLRFDRPIKNFSVLGSGKDARFELVPEMGSDQIRLWHREWSQPWTVDVEWAVGDGKQAGDEGMEGRVVCLWSDDNTEGVIPALDEVRKYAPAWSAVSKLADGLVEGSKPFNV